MDAERHSDSEEEILIYAEFDDSVNIEKYRSLHVLGIDGNSPIIQADDTFFTGKFVNPMGSYMFFEEDPTAKCEDVVFNQLPEKNLKYLFKTNKLLNMEHAYAMPRAGGDQTLKSKTEEIVKEIEEVKFASVEEALVKFRSVLMPTQKSTQEPAKSEFIDINNTDTTEAMET